MSRVKLFHVSLVFLLTLGLAMPALAQSPPAYNSEQPGSVIVFPKFIRDATTDEPDSSFEISVTCPIGLRTAENNGTVCPGFDQEFDVKLRGHWVCPADQSFENKYICRETNFDLHTTVFGTIVINPENTGIRTTDVPQPPCDRGYLIVWVINEAGEPINFNALIGDATIVDANRAVSGYNGITIQALPPVGFAGAPIALVDGGLPFTGAPGAYALVSNNIQSSVRFDAGLDPGPAVTTDLTLLTLDVFSNRGNAPVFVDLNFYNADERLVSTFTHFICWTEVSLSDVNKAATFIDPGLTAAAMGSDKGLVVSGAASFEFGPFVTLLGIATTSVYNGEAFAYSYSLYHEPSFTPTVFAPGNTSLPPLP